MRPTSESWALTPLGEKRLETEVPEIDPRSLADQGKSVSGSDFGQQHHAVIPPFLGPIGASAGLAKIFQGSAFDQNVMLISRFPKASDDNLVALFGALRSAVSDHGLNLLIASDAVAEDTLWANVVTYMWASKYAIVLLDQIDGVLNSNVLIEIGGMLMTGRRCAILRDTSVPQMPSDVVGHIYKSVDLSDLHSCLVEVHRWIRDDLGLGSCQGCPA